MEITTEIAKEVKLRPINVDSSNILFNLINTNKSYLSEWLPWIYNNTKITDTKQFIKASLNKMKEGKEFVTEIWYQNKIVGIISLTKIDNLNKKAEVGYWLDYRHQGLGIMTTAVRSIVSYGFQNLNLNRIAILTSEENSKSAAIPTRLKFTEEGILRNYLYNKDKAINYKVFSVIRTEWLNGLLEE